jgi:hypothetical protein
LKSLQVSCGQLAAAPCDGRIPTAPFHAEQSIKHKLEIHVASPSHNPGLKPEKCNCRR